MHQKILWGGSFGSKNISNFTCLTMQFHKCHHSDADFQCYVKDLKAKKLRGGYPYRGGAGCTPAGWGHVSCTAWGLAYATIGGICGLGSFGAASTVSRLLHLDWEKQFEILLCRHKNGKGLTSFFKPPTFPLLAYVLYDGISSDH